MENITIGRPFVHPILPLHKKFAQTPFETDRVIFTDIVSLFFVDWHTTFAYDYKSDLYIGKPFATIGVKQIMVETTMALMPPAVATVAPPGTVLALFSGGIWDILAQTSFFGVIILTILVVMSLVSWGIMVNKYRLFKEVNLQTKKFSGLFSRSPQISDLLGQVKNFRLTPLSAIYSAGIREADAVMEAKNHTGGLPENKRKLEEDDFNIVNLMLDKTIAEEVGKLEKYVVFLASTANSAPFLGLLGTVVGVMDSFWAIGERGSASLTVVAPGIAEALLATIVGLAAAIPAVIGYNWANNKLKFISDRANNFGLELMARLKKDSYQ
jgi:biopolymer transport protein TolQ